jgi:hypothetical protein
MISVVNMHFPQRCEIPPHQLISHQYPIIVIDTESMLNQGVSLANNDPAEILP